MNDERLKNPKQFGEDYFDELIERIRDIRASEKEFYQKICEIYKTSIDYNSKDEEAKLFFITVQNKIHYGVHGHTVAEVIIQRANATKDNMGLTTFEGAKVRKKDIDIANNYLNEEMTELNRVVIMYLDFAEDQARRHVPMYMKDLEEKLNNFFNMTGREVLSGAGHVSVEQAKKYAFEQYQIYHENRLHVKEEQVVDELIQNVNNIKKSRWKYGFDYAVELLNKLDCRSHYNYESHLPIIINKANFNQMMKLSCIKEFCQTPKVLHKRSVYKNLYPDEGLGKPRKINDVKITLNQDLTDAWLQEDWLSVFDDTVGNNRQYPRLNQFLNSMFPDKCKFEV